MTSSAWKYISGYRDKHGFVWSYTHNRAEPDDMLLSAAGTAKNLASRLAVKERKTYVVAANTGPPVTIFILPFGHPMIVERALHIIEHMLADGRMISGEMPKRH